MQIHWCQITSIRLWIWIYPNIVFECIQIPIPCPRLSIHIVSTHLELVASPVHALSKYFHRGRDLRSQRGESGWSEPLRGHCHVQGHPLWQGGAARWPAHTLQKEACNAMFFSRLFCCMSLVLLQSSGAKFFSVNLIQDGHVTAYWVTCHL